MMDKWDYAHMKTAEVYADLSSAKRAQVGAVIVKDHRVISIGYNGMPSGWDNTCEYKVSLPQKEIYGSDNIVDMAFRYTLKTRPEVLHAEANAIAKIARSPDSCEDSTIYCTMMPCLDCAKLIYQSGIRKVFYRNDYPKGTEGFHFLKNCGIMVEQI